MSSMKSGSLRILLLGISLASAAAAGPAAAFDIQSGVTKESGPFDLFKFGFNAYKNGQKEDAVEAYRYAADVMLRNMMARDAEEGICAFVEKREPKWQGC